MIKYDVAKDVDYKRLVELFKQAGWTDKTKDINRLQSMVENSQIVVTAWKDSYMVGFARCTTDYVFNGQINNVVVDLAFRNMGIGKGLIARILESNREVTYILRGDLENEGFYKSLGFVEAERTLIYKRKR